MMERVYVAVRARKKEREREANAREEEADKKRRMYIRDMVAVEEDERMEEGWRDTGEKEGGREREKGILEVERGGWRSVIDKDGEGGRKKEGKRWEEWGDSGGRSETGSGWSCAPTPV